MSISYLNGPVKISLMRRKPNLTLEGYTAAVNAMTPQELQDELASARRQFSSARLNILSAELRDDFAVKFDALLAVVRSAPGD